MSSKPNIVVIMTDQQRADLSKRNGFSLDTTPFLDCLAAEGTTFQHAYTSYPVCTPARISMLTGRFPGAHGIRGNEKSTHPLFERDLFHVAREQGYATAMVGKNHSHLQQDRVDHWFELNHNGGMGEGRTEQEKAFDQWLFDLKPRIGLEPTPFPLECQGPYRAVSDAQTWIDSLDGSPFCMWLSFAEPHNPYQVPEPYFSMFPPESLPPVRFGAEALAKKSFKWKWTKHIGDSVYPEYDELIPRARANYFGMLRLIDDQIGRFVDFLEAKGLLDNTLLVFVSDHGDFVGEYGLIRKGPEMPEVLMRIPLFFVGPRVQPEQHPAFVSIVDIMPTICEVMGAPLPMGVQGRSLWPLLAGDPYPEEEFDSAYAEMGVGGLHITEEDNPSVSKCVIVRPQDTTFNEVNYVSQSGNLRMLRQQNWKLVFDMMGQGQLYDLANDPAEIDNLFDQPQYAGIRSGMVEKMLAWTLRTQNTSLGIKSHAIKAGPRNYWSDYRKRS